MTRLSLRSAGIDIAVTYGDPSYDAKVGFGPIGEADAHAPFPLNHPEGSLGPSSTEGAMTQLNGPPRCVEALNDPACW